MCISVISQMKMFLICCQGRQSSSKWQGRFGQVQWMQKNKSADRFREGDRCRRSQKVRLRSDRHRITAQGNSRSRLQGTPPGRWVEECHARVRHGAHRVFQAAEDNAQKFCLRNTLSDQRFLRQVAYSSGHRPQGREQIHHMRRHTRSILWSVKRI